MAKIPPLRPSKDLPVDANCKPLTQLSDLAADQKAIISSPTWCEFTVVMLKAHDGTYPWCPLEFEAKGRRGFLQYTGTGWKVFYEQ